MHGPSVHVRDGTQEREESGAGENETGSEGTKGTRRGYLLTGEESSGWIVLGILELFSAMARVITNLALHVSYGRSFFK